MSKPHKKPSATPAAPQKGVPRTIAPVAESAEPIAERRPIPVFLIVLLGLLIYGGDMYLMDHGADVMGKAGPFPKQVFDPYKTFEDVVSANPVDPKEEARNKGRAVFNLACIACHQATGQGVPGQFPPLAGSDWVNAEGPNRILRGVLAGLGGPITVSGSQFNNAMPPWKDTLTDEQVAHVLTFVRSEWGNKAAPVTVDQVKKVRSQVADRGQPFSESELKSLPDKVE